MPSRRRFNALDPSRRFLTVAAAVTRIYGTYKSLQLLSKVLPPEQAERLLRRQHRRAAELVYATATQLEGLLIKACQFLGTRADVLPDEYIEVLSRLQDRVPARPYSQMARVVERELDKPVDTLFSD